MRESLCVLPLMWFALSNTAAAQSAATPAAGVRTHDGFMLRFTIGIGGSYLPMEGSIEHEDGSRDYSGFSIGSAFDIGGAPIENLALHARLATLDTPDPNLSTDEGDFESELAVNAGLFAPAITYYLMPANVYLTGAIGLCVVSFTDDSSALPISGFRINVDIENETSTTHLGIGVNLDVGKEWWVGSNWGLGVAGRLWYAHATVSEDEPVQLALVDNLVSFTVLFSATYQ